MSAPFKWTIVGVFIVLVVIVGAIGFSRHNANVRTLQEVQFALESSNIGAARDGNELTLSSDAVTNMIAEVIKTQKNNGNDIRVNYAFLNKDNEITSNPESANSIQFQIQLLKDKKVVSTSESRLVLKEIENG
ncbi:MULTISPECIES: hypothetical protein [Bacillus subtilis group]|uniref:hypothetical protein n=1 Tax=Bacillus subtilis group TaxID=653685 RepID=UPI002DB99EE2|nr:hypothetical protein [Bacillus subtilis]MEC3664926.1 hypothetical protein [Bacillus subtilis]